MGESVKLKKNKKRISKHIRFENNLKQIYEFFDRQHPNWRNTPNADYIKKRLNQTARKITDNIMKKKTKVLKKEDFKEWPFHENQVIIVQTSKKMISVIIRMQEYALNGLAASALKLKMVHDCGKAIKGKSVSEFIQIGRYL